MSRIDDDVIANVWELHMCRCSADEIAAHYDKRAEWVEFVLELGRAMFGYVRLAA